jgi:hypothetical protein
MAVDLSGKVRTLLDLPMRIALQDIASDGRVLVALNSKRLAMAFSALGDKQDVELSWHDWNVAKDISPDGESVLFEDASEAAGPGYAVAQRKLDGSLPTRLGDGSAGGTFPRRQMGNLILHWATAAHNAAAHRPRSTATRQDSADSNHIQKRMGPLPLRRPEGSSSMAMRRGTQSGASCAGPCWRKALKPSPPEASQVRPFLARQPIRGGRRT